MKLKPPKVLGLFGANGAISVLAAKWVECGRYYLIDGERHFCNNVDRWDQIMYFEDGFIPHPGAELRWDFTDDPFQ